LQVATVSLVCSFFLNGVVFWFGCGGGQWGVPMQKLLVIRVKAEGSTAGFAQLGIVVIVVGGV